MNTKKTLIEKYRSAIDAENTIHLFYRYISEKAKNQNVKKNFFRLFRESKLHQRLLRIILKDSFFQDYKPSGDVCREKGLCPESFSLLGVVSVLRDTESSAVNFYKQILKEETDPLNRDIIKFILKQEKEHFALLKKENEFLKYKEEFKSVRGVNFLQILPGLWR